MKPRVVVALPIFPDQLNPAAPQRVVPILP